VTRSDGVMMSTRGEAPPGRGKGGDDTNWASANLNVPKNKKNPRDRFNWYKWMMKI
jgi:hypothetical protein